MRVNCVVQPSGTGFLLRTLNCALGMSFERARTREKAGRDPGRVGAHPLGGPGLDKRRCSSIGASSQSFGAAVFDARLACYGPN